ncbi:MAG: amino acid adenylation domain-containing protein [Acidobacteriota bacterium]
MTIAFNDQASSQLARDYSVAAGAHSLFEAQVRRFAQSPALIWEGQSLTYEELNHRANQVAHYLMRRGVGPEVRVGLLLERSQDVIVSLLGVLKAGGAYVPLDPNYPEERLAMILDEAELKLVLTQKSTRSKLGAAVFSELCLDGEREAIAKCNTENPDSGVEADNLAYIIYTSGSTGKPKGVMIHHRGLCNTIAGQLRTFRVTPDDRVLQWLSISFDGSVLESTLALCAGAALCVASREAQLSAPVLFRFLRENRITNIMLPPSVLATWEVQELPAVKTIIVAGETCSEKVVAQWAPGRRFFNVYGPTETTVWTSTGICVAGEAKPTIGRPIDNIQYHILDANLTPVPTNTIGDLYIGGIGLARGYFKSPALTAERFIPNPFATVPGERLYDTGDLVRRLPDGQIDFVGRRDQQIKLRGFRIELGDIETALLQHPSVQESVVVLREDQPGEPRLVGYVVLRSLPRITGSDLRSYLKAKLPDYMIPSVFVEILKFPKTPNGKIDRRALPVPAPVSAHVKENFVAPRNPLEEIVAGVWSELLGLDRVGVYDELFELGAHSLMLTRAAARIRDQFNVEIPLRCFFDSPTVASLAAALETTLERGQQFDLKPIKRVPRDSDLPLSFAQERVLFLQQLYGRSKAYNTQASLRFNGKLDVTALERSLSELIRRHEVFRTTFIQKDGQAIQLIHEAEDRKLPVVDLALVGPDARERRLDQLMYEEINRTFDLEKLPLIRWTLFRLDPEEHLLLQVEHHFLHDGWSLSVLLRELLQIYQAFSKGLPSPLAELPIQFADFAVWQREFMQGPAAENQLAYWKRKLTDAPALLPLLTDFPRPPVPSFRGNSLRLELPAPLSRLLRELSRSSGCTLFMTMFAVFVALMHRYTNQEDFCIGTGLANRRWKETEGLLGMILNTVALRADLSGDPSFEELLRRVREVTVDAYANQDLPFDRVIEAIQPARSLSYSPLYQVTFSFHDAPLVEVDLPDLNINIKEALSNESAKFDLNVIVIPEGGQQYRRQRGQEESGMILIWEYNTDLFRADTIGRLFTHYQNLLAAVVSDPSRRISEYSVLTDLEEDELLRKLNETGRRYQPGRCVHELFAEMAARTPDAPAVADDKQQWSYEELDRRSNQLAHRLRALGVGPESRVAVLLDRSCEFVLAMLAVIKAGAAYVPLDPQHPSERILFILREVGASAVLSVAHIAKNITGTNAQIILLDRHQAEYGAEPETPLPLEVAADNLAYVIYTSGSTGTPKGVAVTHSGLMNLVRWHHEIYVVSSDDRASQVAGQSFDASTWEVWPYLTAGASLHVAPAAVVKTPQLLVSWLVKNKISISFLPTPLAEAMLAESWPETCALRYLLTGGERLHVVTPEHWPFVLVNHYGPTEYSVVATSWIVNGELTPPIGRPIANSEVYVLDRAMKPVPRGVEGELYLSGAGLARGYWLQPSLTAERFLPNPFSREKGGRLYHTGDLVRYLPNGELEFRGRIDGQVKVRGYRIELGEIETVLRRHANVREAVVQLRQRADGKALLIGYVVFIEDNGNDAPTELGSYLREHLPEYMVPSQFVLLPELPLNSSGKIDRSALPDPDLTTSTPAFVAPRNEHEEVVARIWAEVLGLNRVGVEDNFFRLGGHSLLATRILSRVNSALQVEIPLDSLFRGGTVAHLVEVAQQRKNLSNSTPLSMRRRVMR